MMFFKNVKLMFWGEVVLCAIYNRSPSIALQSKTPYEMWYSHLPRVKHFRVFGCTCYALIPAHLRNKLEVKSRKCIFWDILLLPKLTVYMMRRIKNSFFIGMLYFLNLTNMHTILKNNFLILIDFNQKNSIMNGIMNFQLLKGGFPF